MPILIISNKKIADIIRIVQSLERSRQLLEGASKRIENVTKH